MSTASSDASSWSTRLVSREWSVTDAAATAVLAAVVITAVVLGRPFLLPLAVACLCAFALGPLVSALRRWIPQSLAVGLAVVSGCAVVGVLAGFLSLQLVELAGSMTEYRQHLHAKVTAIRELAEGRGVVGQFFKVGADLAAEFTQAVAPLSSDTAVVRVQSPPPTPIETIVAFAEPLLAPAFAAGMILILVVFMLLERDRVRDLFVALCGGGDVHGATLAINDASERVSRYLALQLLTNASFAAVVSAGLYALGVPNPVLWGLLGGALRFVPYAGAVLGALLPTLIALAVSPDWTTPLLTLGMIVAIDIVLGQIVEPLLFGLHTGVSPLALLVSAIFWGIAWGPVGLLLSTPMTVCLAVIGRHAKPLRFLETLLGARPGLPPYLQAYQRLLTGASLDVASIVAACRTKRGDAGVEELLGRVIVQAEADRIRGRLRPGDAASLAQGVDEVLAHEAPDSATTDETAAGDLRDKAKVSCVAGRGPLDAAAASLVETALRRRSVPARAGGEELSAEVVAVCFASEPSAAVLRYALRKAERTSEATLVPCILTFDSGAEVKADGAARGDVTALCDVIARRLVATARGS